MFGTTSAVNMSEAASSGRSLLIPGWMYKENLRCNVENPALVKTKLGNILVLDWLGLSVGSHPRRSSIGVNNIVGIVRAQVVLLAGCRLFHRSTHSPHPQPFRRYYPDDQRSYRTWIHVSSSIGLQTHLTRFTFMTFDR